MPQQLPFLDQIQIAVICSCTTSSWRKKLESTAELKNPPLYLSTFKDKKLDPNKTIDVLVLDMPAFLANENIPTIQKIGASLVIIDCKETEHKEELTAAGIKRIDFDLPTFSADVTALITQIIEAKLLEGDDLAAAKKFVAESLVSPSAPKLRLG